MVNMDKSVFLSLLLVLILLLLSLTAMSDSQEILSESVQQNNRTEEETTSLPRRRSRAGQGAESCGCGTTVSQKHRIVGGQEVESASEMPWVCSLYYRRSSGFDSESRTLYYVYEVKCGCTIIAKRWVVTASHCVPDFLLQDGNPFILAGSNHLTPKQNDSLSEPIRVQKVVKHPDYDTDSKNNDIALLELSQDLPFGDNIVPACLPYKHRRNRFYKKNGTVAGFGITAYGHSNASETLRSVVLPILTTKQCRKSYSKTKLEITDEMFCTHETGKDACQGDSGSGLIFNDESDGRSYIIGIVSWGVGCATKYPGVFGKVARYLDFIENTTGETFCKT